MTRRIYIILLMAALFTGQPSVFAQDTITEAKTREVLYYLANDSLKGRGNGRPELLQAARFISQQFRQAGLLPFTMQPSYAIPFRPFGGRQLKSKEKLLWNGKEADPELFSFFHPEPGIFTPFVLSDFEIIGIDSFFQANTVLRLSITDKPVLVWSSQPIGKASKKNLFDAIAMPTAGLTQPVLLTYANEPPASLTLSPEAAFYNDMLQYNIIGVLPGKSKADEAIIISAHYDHEGVFKTRKKKDSILNGANDNASGTTALLLLAEYLAKRQDNERTILFCAFSGEELGLLGSADFAGYLLPEKIVAGVNLEMLGVTQYGKNRLFVTGYRHSSLPAILEAGLKKAGIKLKREPNEDKMLFQRSDNFPFALKGIPAHTLMTSDDDDPCYHQPCDEVDRIDVANLTHLIRAVSKAIQPLLAGEVTPTRVQGGFN